MRTLAVVIGVFVIVVLLVSNGVLGGAICVKGIGCLYSSGNGAALDDREQVTISLP